MKKIHFILFAIAFFVFAPAGTIHAQKETKYDKGMGYSKNINGPDDKGVYTIELEAFTTGEIKVEKKSIPADIVLVLDVSGSMGDSFGNTTKLQALKDAVNAFIDIINDNDLYYPDEDGQPDKTKPRNQRLGNRIAIVSYSTTANNRTNGLVALGNSITDNTGVNSLKTTVNGLNANGGTYAHRGMEMAYGIMNDLLDTRQLRTTVFFTDGVPGYWGDWTGTQNVGGTNAWGNIQRREDAFRTANATISAANNIKNLADAGKGIISNVYTISIINNPNNQTQVYLGKTSSNWLGADNMGWYTNTWTGNLANCWNYNYNNGSVGTRNSSNTNFALSATSQDGLKDIFETIASDSGGSDIDLDGSSVAVLDIVSANFTLPPGAKKEDIKVYTAKCNGGEEGALTFATRVEGYPSHSSTEKYRKMTRNDDGSITWSTEEYDIDEEIDVVIKGDNNMIEVTGFDYSSNFCGFDNGTPRGFKVIIDIPVQMDPDAVGGANSDSNEAGSGIYADVDGDGSPDPIVKYEIPQIDLPTNIFIEKEGLKKGESAKFRIERVSKNASDDVKDNPDSPEWEPVTTVFLTNTEGEGSKPMVKVRGLDPNYIYQIIEEPWSWAYTSEAITVTRTDLLITNPFKFKNTPKTDDIDIKIRHAESKATNEFSGSGNESYIDSKTNTRSN